MAVGFNLDRLNRDPDLVALAALPDDVFSFMTRQLDVPAACAALIYGASGQPRVMTAGQVIEAGDTKEILFVRTVPFRLDFELMQLSSEDGFPFSASIELAVQLVPDRIELEAFRKHILGSHREVAQGRLHRHCEEVVRVAANAFVGGLSAAELLKPGSWDGFDAILLDHFKPLGFESGLALGPDPRITLSSPAFEEAQAERKVEALREQQRAAEQERREEASRFREAHLAELEDMIQKVKSMADENGVLDVPELIKTFDAGQRGRLYHGLISLNKSNLRTTEAILLVAGSRLLWFDPNELRKPTRNLKLPTDAGALRSVRVCGMGDDRRILVGARQGVHVLNGAGEVLQTYLVPDRPDVKGGVNAASLLGMNVFATHSEVGLIEWAKDKPEAYSLRLTEFTEMSKAVRDVQAHADHRLWLAVDDTVLGWKPGEEAPVPYLAPKSITTMRVADGYVYAGLKDGSVVRWVQGDNKKLETIRQSSGRTIRSIDCLSGGGVPRLLIGDGSQHLDLHVLGDSYHGEYRCLHEMRWGFGADDIIVGVTETRDYLFTWTVDTPESPAGSVSIRRLIGRSIQDVALI